MYWEFHQAANRPWVSLMEILLRENGYLYIITKTRCCCAFCRGLRTVRGEPLGMSGRESCPGSCRWQQALAAHCHGKLPVVHPGQSAQVWGQTQINPETAAATLKRSDDVGIVSSHGWCSSCVDGQPLWLRLPQMAFLLSAGAFQGFPGARQSSDVRAVLCRTQRELMLLGFRREELLGESSLLLCCLGFFGFFFAAVWFKTD